MMVITITLDDFALVHDVFSAYLGEILGPSVDQYAGELWARFNYRRIIAERCSSALRRIVRDPSTIPAFKAYISEKERRKLLQILQRVIASTYEDVLPCHISRANIPQIKELYSVLKRKSRSKLSEIRKRPSSAHRKELSDVAEASRLFLATAIITNSIVKHEVGRISHDASPYRYYLAASERLIKALSRFSGETGFTKNSSRWLNSPLLADSIMRIIDVLMRKGICIRRKKSLITLARNRNRNIRGYIPGKRLLSTVEQSVSIIDAVLFFERGRYRKQYDTIPYVAYQRISRGKYKGRHRVAYLAFGNSHYRKSGEEAAANVTAKHMAAFLNSGGGIIRISPECAGKALRDMDHSEKYNIVDNIVHIARSRKLIGDPGYHFNHIGVHAGTAELLCIGYSLNPVFVSEKDRWTYYLYSKKGPAELSPEDAVKHFKTRGKTRPNYGIRIGF